MNVYKLSASNIDVFLGCQFHYKLRYHDRLPDVQIPNKWSISGKAFHATAKIYFENNPNPPMDIAKFLSIFAEECSKEGVQISDYRDWTDHIKKWAEKFKFPRKFLSFEKNVDMVFPNGVPVTGFIDRIEEIDDTTIRIIDYKTGEPYDDEKLANDIQAPLYILMVKQMYPDKNVEFEFDFIKSCHIQYTYTNQEMKNFVKYLKGVYDTIIATDPKDVKPKLGNCRFCQYPDQCPLMKQAREGGFKIVAQLSDSLDDLILFQSNMDDAYKSLKDESDRLKELILSKMDDEVYENKHFKAKIQKMSYTNYDIFKVLKAFNGNKYIGEIVSVKKEGLMKHIDELNEHLRAEVEDSVSNNFSRPFIKITKKKGK